MWSKCTNIFDLYSGIPQKQPEITINFSSTLHTADSELGYKSSSCWIDSDQCWHWDEVNLTVWGEIGKFGSCQESNPNTWLVQTVVCHWAATTRQPQTLTIFYMYCTGRTPGSHWVSAVRTSLGVDWKFYSAYFSLFNWENHSAWAFCWWREFSSQTLTGNTLLPPVQYIPYSGKFSNGANFRIIRKHATCAKIKTFENLFWTHVSKKEVERVWKVRRWHFIVSLRSKSLRFRVRTALCLVLSLLLLLKMPTRRLSSVLISVLKLPQSQEERMPSLPLKTKQPLPSTPR